MTQNDVIILAGYVFTWKERAANFRARAKHGKKFRRDDGACQAKRLALPGEIELVAFVIGCDVHGVDLVAHRHDAALGIRARDADKSFRARIGKRNKKNSIHQAEDGRVGSNAKGEREYSDRSETWILTEHAK